MFCKNCGNPLDDTAYVCPHCGTQVGLPDSNSIPGANNYQNNAGYTNNQGYPNNYGYQQPQQPTYPYQNRYDKTNTIAIVGFIFSFLLGLVGLICSIIGYNRAVREGRDYKGLAMAGIIISAISMVFGFILNLYIYS